MKKFDDPKMETVVFNTLDILTATHEEETSGTTQPTQPTCPTELPVSWD